MSQLCEPGTMNPRGESLVGKAVVLFVGAYVLTTMAILTVIRLPDVPLLRYGMFVIPVFTSGMTVTSWYELGALWPAVSLRRSTRHLRGGRVSGAQPVVTQAG